MRQGRDRLPAGRRHRDLPWPGDSGTGDGDILRQTWRAGYRHSTLFPPFHATVTFILSTWVNEQHTFATRDAAPTLALSSPSPSLFPFTAYLSPLVPPRVSLSLYHLSRACMRLVYRYLHLDVVLSGDAPCIRTADNAAAPRLSPHARYRHLLSCLSTRHL